MNRPESSRSSRRYEPFVNGPCKALSITDTFSYYHHRYSFPFTRAKENSALTHSLPLT